MDAGGPYTAFAGFRVGLHGTGSDAEGDALTYAWDLDHNGSFETPGQNATYSAATASAPGSHTIAARAADSGGLTGDDTAVVNVVVTYDSLCALARDRVTKKPVEDFLCKKLQEAEKAEAKGKTKDHDHRLDEFRKKLDHETGKSVGAADAAQLKSLSQYL